MTDRIIANLGWDEERAQDWQQNPLSATGAFFGRVVRVERTTIHIAHEAGLHTVMATGFAVGDWVATDGETWVSLLPRRTQRLTCDVLNACSPLRGPAVHAR